MSETKSMMPATVKGWLTSDYFRQQVALCLPKHLTADRFVRVAMTALTRIPKLAECTPESVVKCMMACSELGIEPDGRRAHLIPFENRKAGKTECQLIIDYKGLVELAKRSGDVSNIHAQIVCNNDAFEYNTGEITHKIDFRKDRGDMYAAYAVITFKDGSRHCEVMTKAEIESVRRRSRAGENGPWVTDFNEMAKKTVFRRASKWVTLSPEIQDALDKEEEGYVAPPTVEVLPSRLPEPEPKEKPAKVIEGEPSSASSTAQDELSALVVGGGYSFGTFRKWGEESGNLSQAELDSMTGFEDVPDSIAKRMLRAKVGLLKGLAAIVAEAGV